MTSCPLSLYDTPSPSYVMSPAGPGVWERVSARPGTKPFCCLLRVTEPPGCGWAGQVTEMDPSLCSLADLLMAGWCPAVSLSKRESAQLLFHHRGPSTSWDNWAVILKGPSRRGCLEHMYTFTTNLEAHGSLWGQPGARSCANEPGRVVSAVL